MTIGPSTVVRRSDDQMSCKLNNEIAILNMSKSLYFGLGEVGAFVWDHIATETTVADLCRNVTERYDVEPAQCETDMIEFLQQLASASLLETVSRA